MILLGEGDAKATLMGDVGLRGVPAGDDLALSAVLCLLLAVAVASVALLFSSSLSSSSLERQ